MAAQVYENGMKQRVVMIEFPSLEQAIAAHDSPAYKNALKALDGTADRDMRIARRSNKRINAQRTRYDTGQA